MVADTLPPHRRLATTARRAPGAKPLRGWGYAAPTAIFVLLVFLVPLGLVVAMSASDWPLMAGYQGPNFPDNYSDAVQHRLFWDSIGFTLKYTVITTILLVGLGLGLALLVQESTGWKSFLRTSFLVPSALGLASASLLFYVLYSPYAGPFADLMQTWGFTFLGTPEGALWSTVFLVVWRYAGFYMLLMLVGTPGHPRRRLRGRAHRRRIAVADLPRHHDPAAAADVRPHDRAVRHGVAARVRAVLHPHQGRPRQQHDDDRPADLQRRVPGPEQPRHRRGPVGHRPASPSSRSTPSNCARSAAPTTKS